MGIFLLLAQVVLVVLGYGAHVVSLSPWVTWLPAILFGAIWVISVVLFGRVLSIDTLNPIGRSPAFGRR